MKFNKRAFKILRKEEQAAITLKNLQNKSSWQAGEILKKSHYKYLEISTRADKFFQLFNQHYNLYGDLIPDYIKIHLDFKKYIELCIEKRLKVGDAIKQIENPAYQINSTREPLVCEGINQLKKSQNVHEQNLYNAIMEFDRYNNFRILPKSVQEPSGFKRRNKTRYKKHLNISVTLQPLTLFRIKEIFQNNSKLLEKEGFVALTNFPHSKDIIRVNSGLETLKRFSAISLYVFKYKSQAEEYIEICFEYLAQTTRDPRKGQLFWPNFRNLVKESLNYHEINNIAPSRKSLHDALYDMDVYYKNKKNLADYKKSFK